MNLKMIKIYNHYLDKRREIMKNTQCKFGDIFDSIIGKNSISLKQTTKLKFFQQKQCEYKPKKHFKLFLSLKKENQNL